MKEATVVNREFVVLLLRIAKRMNDFMDMNEILDTDETSGQLGMDLVIDHIKDLLSLPKESDWFYDELYDLFKRELKDDVVDDFIKRIYTT